MSKNRRIKSRHPKQKHTPIPHNNRGHADRRMVRKQIITMPDPDRKGELNLGKPYMIKKTIFHMNLSPFEERRIHMIKVAIENNDTDILNKLNPRERGLYDNMLKQKQMREGGEANGNGNNE